MNKRILIAGVAVLVLVAAFFLKGSGGPSEDPGKAGQPHASETAGGVEPARTQEAPLPRLVDLGADKCIPCKQMAPILEGLKEEYRGVLTVDFIDVWKNPAASKEWGVRMIPTQVFLDASGRELFRHEGFLSKEAILEKWKELGIDLAARAVETGA